MRRVRHVLITCLGLALLLGTLLGPAIVSADPLTSWTAGPDSALDNTYDGYIDAPSMNATVPTGSFTVTGWFVDKTAQGWAGADDVQVWQGTMDGGGKMLAKAGFAQNRPDVASALANPYWAASGFRALVLAGSVSTGAQTLSVYAHTGGKGWWYKQVNVNASAGAPATAPAAAPAAPAPSVSAGAAPILVIEKPGSGDNVKTKPQFYEMIGYALDKGAAPNQGSQGSGIDKVSVYATNDRDSGGKFLGDATLGYSDGAAKAAYGSQFANSGWRLSFKPTNLKKGSQTLFVYAHSAVTGKETLTTVGITIVENG